MSIKSFFSNSCETRELHIDPQLRTNYYRNRVSEIVDAIKKIAESQRMDLDNYDEQHKEMHFIGPNFDMIVTMSEINPIECGVDFKVNFFVMIGGHRPKNKVVLFYKELKKLLNFKGVSLHP